MRLLLILSISLSLLVSSYQAQNEGRIITDNEVNAIANRLFCPVCENITLDTCGTAACKDWRDEIRLMLADGMTEEEIITDFVQRFGDRVVGTPRDPILRAVSLVIPWLVMIIAAVIAGMTLIHNDGKQKVTISNQESPAGKYHRLLEQDISG